MTTHAILGASSAHRWMECPGSVKLSEGIESKTSAAAVEGTCAHHLCEFCLTNYEDPEDFLDWYISPEGELYKPGDGATPKDAYVVDQIMVEAVRTYVDAIKAAQDELEMLQQLEGLSVDVRRSVEMSFDLSFVRPDMFGTNDACVFASGIRLDVFDFKYGKGKVVEVERNVQLMYYGLGALREACWNKEKGEWVAASLPKTVRLVIIQPRAPHRDGPVRTWEVPVQEILDFEQTLREAADATAVPNAALNAGSWCFFCPAKAICPELRSGVKEALSTDFDDIDEDELTKEKGVELAKAVMQDSELLARALKATEMIDAFVKAIEAHALDELKAGNPVPGFKLVRKGSRRRWINEREAEEILQLVLPDEQLYQPKSIKSFTQIEKIDKDAAAMVYALTEKPEGALTIAPDDDVRGSVGNSSIQDDFKDI